MKIEGINKRPNPEDPFGLGIESVGRFGSEGSTKTTRSVFFIKADQQGMQTPSDKDTGLVIHEFPTHTFTDIAFKMRRPQGGVTRSIVQNVLVVPMSYDQLKRKFEAKGLREGGDQNQGESFEIVDTVVLTKKPPVLTFPIRTAEEHQYSSAIGWGQYIVLCGEAKGKRERITLVEIRRGIIDFPQPKGDK